MSDAKCQKCGGTGDKWNEDRGDWGEGACGYCGGHGFTPELDFDSIGERFA